VLEGKRVIAIRDKARRGRSIKAIARDMGVSRNTVRRYLRQDLTPVAQARPYARRLSAALLDELSKRIGSARWWRTAAVQRWLGGRGVVVSARTLRREVARHRRERARTSLRPAAIDVVERGDDESAAQELQLVRQIARRQRTTDPDELESVLTLHLARLRLRKHSVANWKAYLITGLTWKAKNWLRDRALEGERVMALDAPSQILEDSDVATLHEVIGRMDASPDGRLALRRIRRSLRGRNKRVLDALIANDFNVADTARDLGMHRNTIGKAKRRIRAALSRRGWTYQVLC
jgi:DNA-directed RNA polymerase specialized sigma24 family protein